MSAYAVIDALCDAVTPLLLLAILGSQLRHLTKRRYRASLALLGALLVGLGVVYGFYYLDLVLGLWPRFGLDYSTHSAFVLVMCAIIALFIGARPAMLGVLLLYLLAMVYQQYHSPADVVTTVVAVSALIAPAFLVLHRTLGTEPTR